MGKLTLNGAPIEVTEQEMDMPLLWFIREKQGLTGTKYGCGMSMCGACTVQIDGQAIRSCISSVSEAIDKNLTTIEGLASAPEWGAVLKAWEEIDVPQCGYCQSGQIMSAHALLTQNSKPTKAEVDSAMSGNLCRCGTYCDIRRAIQKASDLIAKGIAP